MKKYIYIFILVILCSFLTFGQQYQRMLISAHELNNLSIPANGNSVTINARCLDEARDLPTNDISLSNILNGSENLDVSFTDNGEKVALSSLLSKGRNGGVELTGSEPNDDVIRENEFINSYSITRKFEEPPYKLHLQNNTGRPLKIISTSDIQVGQINEPPVPTFGAIGQEEIWVNSSIQKFAELGYISNSTFNNLIKSKSLGQRSKKLKEIVKNFELKNNISPPSGDLHYEETQSKFNSEYNYYLKQKADKEKSDYLSKYDIGLLRMDLEINKSISKYKSASDLSENISWENLKLEIKKDFDENIYYLYDKATDSFIKTLISQKTKWLYKYSEPVKNNINQLEETLFSKKIDPNKIHIVNFLSRSEDRATFETLEKLFPDQYSDFSLTEVEKLIAKIKADGIKSIFFLGHFKKGKIFTTVNGKTIEYDIDLLYKIGKRLGVELFFIGCKSSLATNGGTGTTLDVHSIKILNNLFRSLHSSKSWGELFTNLSANSEQENSFYHEFEVNTGIIRVVIYEKIGFRNRTNENTDGADENIKNENTSGKTENNFYWSSQPQIIFSYNPCVSNSPLNLNFENYGNQQPNENQFPCQFFEKKRQ